MPTKVILHKSKQPLSVTHPELAKQFVKAVGKAEGRNPSNVTRGMQIRFVWRCPKETCKHEWEAVVLNRTMGRGCPACANKVVTAKNCLDTTHPYLASRFIRAAKGFESKNPHNVTAGSEVIFIWQCDSCSKEWESSVYNRSRQSIVKCHGCANRRVRLENSLVRTHPQLAREFVSGEENLNPSTVSFGSKAVFTWECLVCQHNYKKNVSSRTQGGGCPACAGKVVTPNTSLAFCRPDIAAEFLAPAPGFEGKNPYNVREKAGVPFIWRCSVCKYQWTVSIDTRTSLNRGCPACNAVGWTEPKFFIMLEKSWPYIKRLSLKQRKDFFTDLGIFNCVGVGRSLAEAICLKEVSDKAVDNYLSRMPGEVDKIINSHDSQRYGKRRKVPQTLRQLVFNRDGYKCLCCGTQEKLVLDHIVPWSDGGMDTLENLRTLCDYCNKVRASRPLDIDQLRKIVKVKI